MSAGVGLEPALSPLDGALRRAGAHMVERNGWMVAADFGSMLSELAVCRAAAGLADVSSIAKLEVRGSEFDVAAVHPSARPLRARRAVESGRAWWCPVSSRLLLVVGALGANALVREEVAERTAEYQVRVVDVTVDRVAVMLVGPTAREVLARAGAGGQAEALVRSASIAGIPTLVLHERGTRWLLVAPGADALELWHALSEAGAPLGLAHVGADALQHLLAAGRS